ncbi:MAG: hypothetical protein SFX73_24570 [Kofleriaceae bacterium]|nr:hypothetical protein [Kofleriaceae bacterium]
MRTYVWLGPLALLGACTDVPSEPPLDRVDLRRAIGAEQVDPVGVAIAANGARYVLDEQRGLYRLEGESATAIVPMANLPPPAEPIRLPVTDLVALAPDVFALTAIGDGFLLDTSALTLTQHFCYEPEGFSSGLVQRTDALTFDAEADRIYAQPVTYDQDGRFQNSQLAVYDRDTGTDIAWHDLDDSVAATGMTLIPDVGLVLGQGSRLLRFDAASARTVPGEDLARFGVRSIDGLVVDATHGTLVVVDGDTNELVEIELAQLAL